MSRPYWELNAERDARQRLDNVKDATLALRREFDTAVAEARSWTDDHYSDQGISDRRAELVREVQARFQNRFADLEQQVRDDTELAARAATHARPQLGDDPSTLMRAQVAWDGVKARLAAGMTPSQILAGADQITALAVAEWGPAYLEAQAYEATAGRGLARPYQAPDPTALTRAVDARLAELDPTFGDAHQGAARAAGAAAHVAPLAAHAATGFTSTGLNAALLAHYGEQAALAEHGVTAADPAGDPGSGEGDAA